MHPSTFLLPFFLIFTDGTVGAAASAKGFSSSLIPERLDEGVQRRHRHGRDGRAQYVGVALADRHGTARLFRVAHDEDIVVPLQLRGADLLGDRLVALAAVDIHAAARARGGQLGGEALGHLERVWDVLGGHRAEHDLARREPERPLTAQMLDQQCHEPLDASLRARAREREREPDENHSKHENESENHHNGKRPPEHSRVPGLHGGS